MEMFQTAFTNNLGVTYVMNSKFNRSKNTIKQVFSSCWYASPSIVETSRREDQTSRMEDQRLLLISFINDIVKSSKVPALWQNYIPNFSTIMFCFLCRCIHKDSANINVFKVHCFPTSGVVIWSSQQKEIKTTWCANITPSVWQNDKRKPLPAPCMLAPA